jgi:hypothetical protein
MKYSSEGGSRLLLDIRSGGKGWNRVDQGSETKVVNLNTGIFVND